MGKPVEWLLRTERCAATRRVFPYIKYAQRYARTRVAEHRRSRLVLRRINFVVDSGNPYRNGSPATRFGRLMGFSISFAAECVPYGAIAIASALVRVRPLKFSGTAFPRPLWLSHFLNDIAEESAEERTANAAPTREMEK